MKSVEILTVGLDFVTISLSRTVCVFYAKPKSTEEDKTVKFNGKVVSTAFSDSAFNAKKQTNKQNMTVHRSLIHT